MTANAAQASAPGLSGSRPRILLADDSRVMRLAIVKILGTDYDLVQTENGAAAWERLSADPDIQAVLTDIQMPVMDGYELICRIRGAEDPRLRQLPVMTITGSDDDAIKQQALACGATDFVIKPLDPMQLRARVQAYVRYDQNVRALAEKSQTLEEQSITDPQTGLRSRRYLMQRGEQDIAFAQRHGQDLALLRIDIDGFKKIYRTHGDEVVDALMPWLAKLLFSSARTEDTVSRVSGAEFAILATNIGMEQARLVSERIVAAVQSQPFLHGHNSISVTVSVGVASLGADRSETIEALYSVANQRLCHATSEGGNRVCTSVMDELPSPVEEFTLLSMDDAVKPEAESSIEIQAETEASLTSTSAANPASPEDDFVELPELPIPAEHSTSESFAFPSDLISVDKALVILAMGKERVLLPYLDQLMLEIQPLIELHQRTGKTRNA